MNIKIILFALIIVLAIWLQILFSINNKKRKIPIKATILLIAVEMIAVIFCSWIKQKCLIAMCLIEIIGISRLLYKVLNKTDEKDIETQEKIINATNAINNNNYLYKINNGNKYIDIIMYSFIGLAIGLVIIVLLNSLMENFSGNKSIMLFFYAMEHATTEGIKVFVTSIFLGTSINFIQHERVTKGNIIVLIGSTMVVYMFVTMFSDWANPQVINTYTRIQQNNNHKISHRIPKNSNNKSEKTKIESYKLK